MAMQRAEVRKGDAMGTGRLLRCLWNMALGWFVDGLLMDCINHRTTDEGRRWWFHVVSCPKIGSFCQLLNIPQNPHSPHSHISIRKHQITIAGALLDEFNIGGVRFPSPTLSPNDSSASKLALYSKALHFWEIQWGCTGISTSLGCEKVCKKHHLLVRQSFRSWWKRH